MRILLIGGTGNLSTAAAAALQAQGHEISLVSRGRTPVPPQYISFIADRKDPVALRHALGDFQPDAVLDFLAYELNEVQGAAEVFAGRTGQYLFISSASVYRKPAKLPITESSPVGNDWWEYSVKKLLCEEWLLEVHRAGRFPVTIVRPSHTYSERWIPNAITSPGYSFAARLERGEAVFVPDDGQAFWTLTTAADLAAGIAGLVGNPQALGEVVHITSDEAMSWASIYREIAAAVGNNAPEIVSVPTDFICKIAPELTGGLKGDKAFSSVFDNSKIKRLVRGFACRTAFREGIRKSVDWLRAHPDDQNLNTRIDDTCNRVLAAWRKEHP